MLRSKRLTRAQVAAAALCALPLIVGSASSNAHAAEVQPGAGDAVALARSLAPLDTQSKAAADSAGKLREQIKALSEQQRKLDASASALRRDVTRQLDAARKAQKRHDASAARAGAKPASADLQKAQAEYRAALESGKAWERDAKAARALEADLERLANEARQLEAQAKATAAQARDTGGRLKPALRALEARTGEAQRTAAQARAQSGFANPQAFEAAQAKSQKGIVAMDTVSAMLSERQKQIGALEQAAKSALPAVASAGASTSAIAPASQCDLTKVDTSEFPLPRDQYRNFTESPKSASGPGELQLRDYGTDKVYQGDINADGKPEVFYPAYVTWPGLRCEVPPRERMVFRPPSGPGFGFCTGAYLFAYESNAQCKPVYRGSIEICEEGSSVSFENGALVVTDRCKLPDAMPPFSVPAVDFNPEEMSEPLTFKTPDGKPPPNQRSEWKLANGKLTLLKRAKLP